MPDLLSHAFIAFTIATLLQLRYDWLTSQYVTVGMAGAFIPDIATIALLVETPRVAATLDLPFSWFGIHTLGGSLVTIVVGVVLVGSEERSRVLSLLSLGAASHLVADALLLKASCRSYALLYPLTLYVPSTRGLDISTTHLTEPDNWRAVACNLAGGSPNR